MPACEEKCQRSFLQSPIFWAILLAIFIARDDITISVLFLSSTMLGFKYTTHPLYMSYLKARWARLPYREADQIPEMSVVGFTRERMLKLSNNLASPIVIRGAVKDSVASQLWNDKYLLENYGNETVLVREMFDNAEGLRMQQRTISDFYLMKEKGRNVSIVGSSAIFKRNPKFRRDLESPQIEKYLVGPNGEGIMAQQLFMTAGGRSWYHAALGNNVFRQIQGLKRWTVISPSENFWLCPDPVITGTSVNTCILKLPTDEREDYIRKMKRATALLQPGDILINAGWWWHDVISYGESTDEMISIAGRIKNLQGTWFNSPLLTFNACKFLMS